MILTPFVNALHKLVHREHNLSMAFGMSEIGSLFLTQETSVKTFSNSHTIHSAILVWTNPMQR